MSAFKKTHKSMQKPHRERSQPENRQHLGLLEKKSDYKQRARNYHGKEDRLRILRKKALERNPDEFYDKMVHKKLKDGAHWIDNKRPEETMTEVQRKLMQTQDLSYLRMKLQMEKKKLKKLGCLVNLDAKPQNKRIIFVDSEQERERKSNELKISSPGSEAGRALSKDVMAEREKLKNEIEKRKQRKKELQVIVDKMELQRSLSDSSIKRKQIKEETKTSAALYKWEVARKK